MFTNNLTSGSNRLYRLRPRTVNTANTAPPAVLLECHEDTRALETLWGSVVAAYILCGMCQDDSEHFLAFNFVYHLMQVTVGDVKVTQQCVASALIESSEFQQNFDDGVLDLDFPTISQLNVQSACFLHPVLIGGCTYEDPSKFTLSRSRISSSRLCSRVMSPRADSLANSITADRSSSFAVRTRSCTPAASNSTIGFWVISGASASVNGETWPPARLNPVEQSRAHRRMSRRTVCTVSHATPRPLEVAFSWGGVSLLQSGRDRARLRPMRRRARCGRCLFERVDPTSW
ncbi:hypothetical protein C8Q77DRAFT_921451 [Trametes polyzona]|nr:hypothetical protein C8Q77DRAFT_921451 [Trametes polyzona]